MSVQSVVSLILEGKDEGFSDVLDNAGGGLGNLAGSIGSLAAVGGAVGAIVAVGSALNDMTNMAADAESAISDMQIRTGSTTEELEGMKESIYDIRSSGLGESFENTAEAMGTVRAITQTTGDQLEDTTRKALLLDDVFAYDVQESVRAVDTAMENFGVTSDAVFDLIVTGYQKTGDPASDLLDTINEYSADFSAAGFTAEEFFAVLVAGGEAGAFNLDKVADSVREFTTRIVDGSDTTRQALDDIGIGADNLYAAFQDGSLTTADSLGLVIQALEGIEDPIAQDAAGVALFGSLWEDLGAEMILALDSGTESLGEFEGAADTAFETATTGLNNTAAAADAAKERFQIMLGEALLPAKTAAYQLGVIALGGAELVRRAAEEAATASERYHEMSEGMVAAVQSSETLTDAQGGITQSFQVSNEVLFLVGEQVKDVADANEAYRIQADLLKVAQDLVRGGFEGTTVELIEMANQMLETSVATEDLGIGINDLDEAEAEFLNNMQGTGAELERQQEQLRLNAIAALEAAAAKQHAAIVAENYAIAQEGLAERTQLANEAIGELRERLSTSFGENLDILEAGNQMASFNDVVRDSLETAGAGTVVMAAYELSIGEASEEAVIGALKMALFEEGIQAIAAAAAADGQITRDELGGIMQSAQDLQTTLDQDFTFAFSEEGAEGVLEVAGNITSELEAATAAEYNIFLGADNETATTNISATRQELLGMEELPFVATLEADTTTADDNISSTMALIEEVEGPVWDIEFSDNTDEEQEKIKGVETAVTTLTTPDYHIFMNSDAPDVNTDVANLQGALDSLSGRSYTFSISADTSGVPDWAIPHSPLPIHTAWMDFADDMSRMQLEPAMAGVGGSPVGSGSDLIGAGGEVVHFHGDIIVGSQQNEASRLFMAWLEQQRRIAERSNF